MASNPLYPGDLPVAPADPLYTPGAGSVLRQGRTGASWETGAGMPQGEGMRGFHSSFQGSLANIESYGAELARGLGFVDFAKKSAESAIRRAQEAQAIAPFTGIDDVNDVGSAMRFGMGAVGGGLGSAVIPALAGVAGGARAAAASLVPISGGEITMDQQINPSPTASQAATLGASTLRGLSSIMLNMPTYMSAMGRGPLAAGVKGFFPRMATTSLSSATGEAGEEITGQLAKQYLTDNLGQPLDPKAIRDAAIYGAVAEAPFALSHGVAGIGRDVADSKAGQAVARTYTDTVKPFGERMLGAAKEKGAAALDTGKAIAGDIGEAAKTRFEGADTVEKKLAAAEVLGKQSFDIIKDHLVPDATDDASGNYRKLIASVDLLANRAPHPTNEFYNESPTRKQMIADGLNRVLRGDPNTISDEEFDKAADYHKLPGGEQIKREQEIGQFLRSVFTREPVRKLNKMFETPLGDIKMSRASVGEAKKLAPELEKMYAEIDSLARAMEGFGRAEIGRHRPRVAEKASWAGPTDQRTKPKTSKVGVGETVGALAQHLSDVTDGDNSKLLMNFIGQLGGLMRSDETARARLPGLRDAFHDVFAETPKGLTTWLNALRMAEHIGRVADTGDTKKAHALKESFLARVMDSEGTELKNLVRLSNGKLTDDTVHQYVNDYRRDVGRLIRPAVNKRATVTEGTGEDQHERVGAAAQLEGRLVSTFGKSTGTARGILEQPLLDVEYAQDSLPTREEDDSQRGESFDDGEDFGDAPLPDLFDAVPQDASTTGPDAPVPPSRMQIDLPEQSELLTQHGLSSRHATPETFERGTNRPVSEMEFRLAKLSGDPSSAAAVDERMGHMDAVEAFERISARDRKRGSNTVNKDAEAFLAKHIKELIDRHDKVAGRAREELGEVDYNDLVKKLDTERTAIDDSNRLRATKAAKIEAENEARGEEGKYPSDVKVKGGKQQQRARKTEPDVFDPEAFFTREVARSVKETDYPGLLARFDAARGRPEFDAQKFFEQEFGKKESINVDGLLGEMYREQFEGVQDVERFAKRNTNTPRQAELLKFIYWHEERKQHFQNNDVVAHATRFPYSFATIRGRETLSSRFQDKAIERMPDVGSDLDGLEIADIRHGDKHRGVTKHVSGNAVIAEGLERMDLENTPANRITALTRFVEFVRSQSTSYRPTQTMTDALGFGKGQMKTELAKALGLVPSRERLAADAVVFRTGPGEVKKGFVPGFKNEKGNSVAVDMRASIMAAARSRGVDESALKSMDFKNIALLFKDVREAMKERFPNYVDEFSTPEGVTDVNKDPSTAYDDLVLYTNGKGENTTLKHLGLVEGRAPAGPKDATILRTHDDLVLRKLRDAIERARLQIEGRKDAVTSLKNLRGMKSEDLSTQKDLFNAVRAQLRALDVSAVNKDEISRLVKLANETYDAKKAEAPERGIEQQARAEHETEIAAQNQHVKKVEAALAAIKDGTPGAAERRAKLQAQLDTMDAEFKPIGVKGRIENITADRAVRKEKATPVELLAKAENMLDVYLKKANLDDRADESEGTVDISTIGKGHPRLVNEMGEKQEEAARTPRNEHEGETPKRDLPLGDPTATLMIPVPERVTKDTPVGAETAEMRARAAASEASERARQGPIPGTKGADTSDAEAGEGQGRKRTKVESDRRAAEPVPGADVSRVSEVEQRREERLAGNTGTIQQQVEAMIKQGVPGPDFVRMAKTFTPEVMREIASILADQKKPYLKKAYNDITEAITEKLRSAPLPTRGGTAPAAAPAGNFTVAAPAAKPLASPTGPSALTPGRRGPRFAKATVDDTGPKQTPEEEFAAGAERHKTKFGVFGADSESRAALIEFGGEKGQGLHIPSDGSPESKARTLISLVAKSIGQAWAHEDLHHFFMLLRELGGEGGKVLDAFTRVTDNPVLKERALGLLTEGMSEAEAKSFTEHFNTDAEERAAYMYQLRSAGLINLNPAAERLHQRIFKWIKDKLGFLSDAEKVENVLRELDAGRLASDFDNPSAIGRAMGQEKRLGLASQSFMATMKPIAAAIGDAFTPSQELMEKSDNPAMKQIANLYGRYTPDDKGKQGVYHERRKLTIGLQNEIGKVINAADNKERDAALAEVVRGAPESELAKQIDAFLKKYSDGRGLPFIPDREAVDKNYAEFLHDTNITNSPSKDKIREAMMPVDEGEIMGINKSLPKVQFKSEEKKAKWTQKDASQYLGEFIFRHASQKTRTEAFGADGSVLTNLIKQVRESGSGKDYDLMKRYIGGAEGWLGADMDPRIRTLQNVAIAGLNIAYLPFSVLSAMVEPIYIGARSGSVQAAFTAYGLAMKSLIDTVSQKGGKLTGEAAEFAEEIRLMEQGAASSAAAEVMNNLNLDKFSRMSNDFFFRWNFMRGVDRAMIAAAAVAGRNFLVEHGTSPGKNSVEFLKELGLTAEDVQLTPDGKLKVFERDGLSPEHADKIQSAIHAFARRAVAMPTPLSNSPWMNDKRFAMFAHMKPFVMAQSAGILSWMDEQRKKGNYTPMFMATAAAPVQLATSAVRSLLTGAPPVGGVLGTFAETIARAGLLGRWDFAYDVFNNAVGGRGLGTGIEAIGGPGVETAFKWGDELRAMVTGKKK